MTNFLGIGSFLAEMVLSSRTLAYLGPLIEIGSARIGSGVGPNGNLILASLELGNDVYSAFGAPVRAIGGIQNAGYGTVLFDMNLSGQKQPLITGLANPASLLASPLTPGQLVEVRGIGLGPGSPSLATDSSNPPLELAGTQLMIDGVAAPLLSVQDNSILALAPAVGFISPTSVISVTSGGSQSDSRTVPTASVNPALFTTSGTGVGQAIAVNTAGSANSSANPAKKGQVLRLFATGLGSMTATRGTTAPNASITATVEGLPAQVSGVASAAGYPAGYFAVDIVVPSGAPEGDFVLVAIAADGTPSQPGVTVSIR